MTQSYLEQRPVLSVAETATLLGVHHSTLRHEIAAGTIRSIRVGRRILIPRAELDRLLAGDPARPAPSPAPNHERNTHDREI